MFSSDGPDINRRKGTRRGIDSKNITINSTLLFVVLSGIVLVLIFILGFQAQISHEFLDKVDIKKGEDLDKSLRGGSIEEVVKPKENSVVQAHSLAELQSLKEKEENLEPKHDNVVEKKRDNLEDGENEDIVKITTKILTKEEKKVLKEKEENLEPKHDNVVEKKRDNLEDGENEDIVKITTKILTKEEKKVLKDATAIIQKPYRRTDQLVEMANHLRLFKDVYSRFILDNSSDTPPNTTSFSSSSKEVELFLQTSVSSIFPWLRTSIQDMASSFNGRGIVICMSKRQMKYGRSLIKNIRKLGCNLPIEIFYIGEREFNEFDKAIFLNNLDDNIQLRDITEIFKNEIIALGGYAIKPFAMLGSSFSEVILMDVDNVFVKSPDMLFDAKGYKDTGTLFYKDRTIAPAANIKNWVDRIFTKPLRQEILQMRTYQRKSYHEQESGVVLIDKGRRLIGLLATCKLNERVERDRVTYKLTHGEKESFWIGFEMIHEPFYFSPYLPGAIGEAREKGPDKAEVCSQQLLHLDESGEEPFWWNSALFVDKRAKMKNNSLVPSFKHFLIEEEGKNWDYDEKGDSFCLSVAPKDMRNVKAEMSQFIEEVKSIFASEN